MASCTTNGPCSQGYCCEMDPTRSRYLTCTNIPGTCYTGDGTRSMYAECSSNSQCATDCCDNRMEKCNSSLFKTTKCMAALPDWAIITMVIGGMALVGLIVCLILSYGCKRRRCPSCPHGRSCRRCRRCRRYRR